MFIFSFKEPKIMPVFDESETKGLNQNSETSQLSHDVNLSTGSIFLYLKE